MDPLTVREAADALGVHPARITHLITSGRLIAEWAEGAHGRERRVDPAAIAAIRRDLGLGEPPDEPDVVAEPDQPTRSKTEGLARARAVESYTAGLAATAIAPAVSRLVETIEQLIRENGDLREEVGALKARLETVTPPPEPDLSPGTIAPERVGMTSAEWELLNARLERLSEPMPAPPHLVDEAADLGPSPLAQEFPPRRVRSRPRSGSPLARLMRWLGKAS